MSEIFLGFSNKPIDLEFLNETLSKASSRLGLKRASKARSLTANDKNFKEKHISTKNFQAQENGLN